MSQQPAEEAPLLTLDPAQTSAPIPPLTDAAEPTTDPPASAGAPKYFSKPRRKFSKRRIIAFCENPVLLGFLGFLLVMISVFVALASNVDGHSAFEQLKFDGNGVAILGDVSRFDWRDTHQLSMTWSIIGLGEYSPRTVVGNPYRCLSANRAIDVYLDDASKPAFSFDPALLPMASTGERFCPSSLVSFNTEHWIASGDQFSTPMGRYGFTAFVFAVESATNKSIPITGFAVGDSNNGPLDFTTTSVDVQTTNNFTYDTKDGLVTVQVESRTLTATVKHSSPARALTFSMFAINWVLTLGSVAIALIVFKRRGDVKDGVAFLPITVILSIPTIRGLYVGSPPFGILIDMYGFFPQMMIVVVCTVTILCVFAMRSTQDRGITSEKTEV